MVILMRQFCKGWRDLGMVGTSGLFQGNFAGFLVKINELKYNLFF